MDLRSRVFVRYGDDQAGPATITGKSEYLVGPIKYLVEWVDERRGPIDVWVSEEQLTLIEDLAAAEIAGEAEVRAAEPEARSVDYGEIAEFVGLKAHSPMADVIAECSDAAKRNEQFATIDLSIRFDGRPDSA